MKTQPSAKTAMSCKKVSNSSIGGSHATVFELTIGCPILQRQDASGGSPFLTEGAKIQESAVCEYDAAKITCLLIDSKLRSRPYPLWS